MLRWLVPAALLLAAAAAPAPAWLFPFPDQAPAVAPPDAATPLTVPGSTVTATAAAIANHDAPVDWHPERGAVPAPISRAVGGEACAYCHMTRGEGKTENASLAGLPAAYIVRQVEAFAKGERDSAHPFWINRMAATARATPPEQVRIAAAWFAARPYRKHVRVVETAEVPALERMPMIWRQAGGGREALGNRLIEVPDDWERFERRDSDTTYTAYVPPGSIARGAALAASGGPAGLACAGCHGERLEGGDVGPPLAGRSPAYLARQLVLFRTGHRRNAEAEPMRAVAAALTDDDVVALAAHAGSLTP